MIEDTLLQQRLALFPTGTSIRGVPPVLTIAGQRLDELAENYGTPLYIYDQATMDLAVATYRRALQQHYPAESAITYAGKAFLCLAVAQWAIRHGLWLDCTGAGELHIAATASAPPRQVLVHGVNKSPEDLDAAIAQAGTIVVDNLAELERLAAAFNAQAKVQAVLQRPRLFGDHPLPEIWLRLRPGMAVGMHQYTQTGQEDSKFGLSFQEALQVVHQCLEAGLPLTGVHFHLGSHFHDPQPLAPALDAALDFLSRCRDEMDWSARHLCAGGGWGVPYHEKDLPHPDVESYVAFIARHLVEGCKQRGLALPNLHLEPGRSIIAQAGVAVYRVGLVKNTQGRRWLLLDGGMADNIRPALYGARYSALPVLDPERQNTSSAWLAGPYCESGDIMIHDLPMPEIRPGEWIAVPVSGAYHLSMGSNYNGARRPAVLWLNPSGVHLIQQRETLDGLLQRDFPFPG
jgi:diaminopimelate decarboxylase